MKCKKPFVRHGSVIGHGCGQCLPCRIKLRRELTHRGMLESLKHGDSCFVTLTYKYVTYGGLDEKSGTLDPRHTTLWLKRLRERCPQRLRFLLVGEYGDDTERPHYHAIIFGLPACARGETIKSGLCCSTCDLVRETWGKGHILVGSVTKSSIEYVAGYLTKKMTRADDPRLNGRHPEFRRSSQGIGRVAVPDIAKMLTTDTGSNFIIEQGDVPSVLAHGGKKFPLGRYLRKKIREELGFKNTDAQEGWALKASAEMCQLHETAQNDQDGSARGYQKSFAQKMQDMLNIETKHKLFRRKKNV